MRCRDDPDGRHDVAARLRVRSPRPHAARRRALLDLERHLGRAHAGLGSNQPLRRQHLLSASLGARLLREQHRRRHRRRPGMAADAQPLRDAQLGAALRILDVRARRLAAGAPPDWQRRSGAVCGSGLRLLPVLLRAYVAHPAADGRRHPAGVPDAAPPCRRPVDAARRGAGPRARAAGPGLRVLRHLGRPDDRLRRDLSQRQPPLVDPRLLDVDSGRGDRLGHLRRPVLHPVSRDPGRRLSPHARREPALLRQPRDLHGLVGTRAPLVARAERAVRPLERSAVSRRARVDPRLQPDSCSPSPGRQRPDRRPGSALVPRDGAALWVARGSHLLGDARSGRRLLQPAVPHAAR